MIYRYLAVLAAILFFLTLPSYAEQVLKNPSFESGSSHWYGIEIETSEVYSGAQSGRINQLPFWRTISQTFDCEAGQIMSFGGFLKSENIEMGAGGLRVTFYDSSDRLISSIGAGEISGNKDWTSLHKTVVVPSGAEYANFQLILGRGTSTFGSVYFDDLFLELFEHKAFMVNHNGGFENGYVSWNQGHANLNNHAYSGTYSSALQHSAWWKQSWYEFDIDPELEYAVSFAAASDDTTSDGVFQIRYYDASDSEIGNEHLLNLLGKNEFSLYFVDGIHPPLGAVHARFYFAAAQPGTGTTYLDDVVITSDVPHSDLVSPTLINQNLISLTPDPGMESGVSDWSGNTHVEASFVAKGEQSIRFNGEHFFLRYAHDLIPATEGTYYMLSLQYAAEGIAVSPALSFSFYAADGITKLDSSNTLIDVKGTAPYREVSSPYHLAPIGTAYVKIGLAFPGGNSGAKLYLDEVHLYELSNLPVRLVSTYESISVYIGRFAQVANEVAHVYYRQVGSAQWSEAYVPEFDGVRGEYRSSIVGLNADTDYEVQVVLEADGVKLDEAGSTVSTWEESPTIGQTLPIGNFYSGEGQLLIENMHGEPDAWIKITGTGTSDIDGGYTDDVALKIVNSSYLIFEDIEISGGRRHAVQVQMSDHIRIVDCEVSGWARQPNYFDGKYWYETESDLNGGINYAINKDAGIFLDASSRVTVERCYMHDPRTSANNWSGNSHPAGPSAIYVRNISGTQFKPMKGNFVVRYNDLIGSNEIRWNDAIEGENNQSTRGSFYRDTDVYGNMLAFSNDDSTELDGGQMNIRFFGNRIENCYVGLSLAPTIVGPTYVYQNLMFDLGDDRNASYSSVKLGGGTTYSKGKSFFFNNTIIGKGNGLTGVGYGSDSNRTMFLMQSRNNIIRTTNSHPNYSRTISDPETNVWNSFDYDNLSTADESIASVNYALGQEANGILNAAPTFMNATAGDFRLASGSSGIDSGLDLLNFTNQFLGAAPDQGAIEYGGSSLFPIRPVAVSSDHYVVILTSPTDGVSNSVNVVLTSGELDGSLNYHIRMNDTVDWLFVTPATGSLSANSSQTLTFSLRNIGLSEGESLEATILVRFDDGLSVPITVRAEAP